MTGAGQPVAGVTRNVRLDDPSALAVSPDGDLLIDNQGTNQILERSRNGALSAFAGDGRTGQAGDGGLATTAELDQPGLSRSPRMATSLSLTQATTGSKKFLQPD